MKVGLDLSSLPYGTGVSYYTSNLARALIPYFQGDDSLTLFASSLRQYPSVRQTIHDLLPPDGAHVKLKTYHFPPKFISWYFHQLNAPLAWLTGPLDVFHAWDWYVPSVRKTRLISTIHDISLFLYPDTAHPQIRAHHEMTISRLKKFNAHIITVSETTKADLISRFNFMDKQITVIPEALPEEAKITLPDNISQSILQRFQLDRPYFLMVGTLEPRKNYKKQIAAWLPFRNQYHLVIAGKPGWEELPQYEGIHVLGHVNSQELAALYKHAALLLYVSKYEGFGLPILEAFFHQVPVVTAKNSGMLEVAGAAAGLAVPESSEDIARTITYVLENKTLLVAKGLERLKLFSWDKAAQATLAVYKNIALSS